MSDTHAHSKCSCKQCGGHIEFPSEGAGMWIRCPHCGEKTQLTGPSSVPKKKSKSYLSIVILVIIGIAAMTFNIVRWVRRSHSSPAPQATTQTPAKPATAQKPAPEPDLWKGFKPGPVSIDKSGKSRLVYAVVAVKNDTDKQRFGVKVTLDILDGQGEKLGTTSDYTQFIDAHKEWTFKALVAYPKATAAKVTAITEE